MDIKINNPTIPSEFNLWDNHVKVFDHIHDSIDIIDIYTRASFAYMQEKNSDSTSKNMANVLAPYVEEFNQAWHDSENNMEFSFELAQSLDNKYFPTYGDNLAISTYWRAEFKYPAIDTVLYRPQFSYTIPKCGMIVIDHGLLTMKVCLNDRKILKGIKLIDLITKKHIKYHQNILCSEISEYDCTDEKCITWIEKINKINNIISKISALHYDYDNLDDLPGLYYN
jgi:hypothetical protein